MSDDSHARIVRAITWAQNRLTDCDRTQRESMTPRSRDWAYGEEIALKAMLHILCGEGRPDE